MDRYLPHTDVVDNLLKFAFFLLKTDICGLSRQNGKQFLLPEVLYPWRISLNDHSLRDGSDTRQNDMAICLYCAKLASLIRNYLG
jgi:hypothetical protein